MYYIIAIMFRQPGFIALKRLLNYLVIRYFDHDPIFQKRVVRTKLDIYVFIALHGYIIIVEPSSNSSQQYTLS